MTYRAMDLSPFTENVASGDPEPAKVAKPANPKPYFSNFSRFSRGSVSESNPQSRPGRQGDAEWSQDDWQAFFDERAAFAEYEGGQPRAVAKANAYECCIIEWLCQHPCWSDPRKCAHCGGPDQEDNIVIPFGTDGSGHTWLHSNCWQQWYERRRLEAIAALATYLGRAHE